MPHIDSDDPVAADLITGLLSVLADAGGWVHPRATVVVRGGAMSVHVPTAAGESSLTDAPLVAVPESAMVRVARLRWSVDDGLLTVSDPSDQLGDVEREVLYLLVGLLNQCGTLRALQGTHPVLADLSEETIKATSAFRPSFGRRRGDPVAVLWSTRCLRIASHGSAGLEPVAVPIFDLINHRADGAVPSFARGSLTAPVGSVPGVSEVFLNYGLDRDAIGMAVTYGFADHSAQVAHSAPLDVTVPVFGRIGVAAAGRALDGSLLPMLALNCSPAVLSRVTFTHAGLPVDDVARALQCSRREAALAAAAIAEANLRLCDRLAACSAVDRSPAAGVLGAAAGIQAAVIRQALAEGPAPHPGVGSPDTVAPGQWTPTDLLPEDVLDDVGA